MTSLVNAFAPDANGKSITRPPYRVHKTDRIWAESLPKWDGAAPGRAVMDLFSNAPD